MDFLYFCILHSNNPLKEVFEGIVGKAENAMIYVVVFQQYSLPFLKLPHQDGSVVSVLDS